MFVLETFNEELYERDLKKIAYEEGVCAGKEEGFRTGQKEGFCTGKAVGSHEKLKELVQRKLAKGKSVEEIADALEESAEEIKKIVEEIKSNGSVLS